MTRRGIGLAAFLLCFFLGSCQSALPQRTLKPTEQANTAVKVVSVCDGRPKFGSGVLVAHRLVVTAHHVAPCGEAQVEGIGADAFSSDEDADITVLHLHRPLDGKTATLGPTPKIDDRVCLEPTHPYARRSCGWVVGRDSGLIRMDAFIWPGNSGSGVWDSQGRLVGIVTTFRIAPNAQVTGGSAATLDDKRELFGGAL